MTVYSTALISLAAARQQLEGVASRVSRLGVAEPARNDAVELGQEMVRLLAVRATAKTAAKLVETANEVERSVLDVLA